MPSQRAAPRSEQCLLVAGVPPPHSKDAGKEDGKATAAALTEAQDAAPSKVSLGTEGAVHTRPRPEPLGPP